MKADVLTIISEFIKQSANYDEEYICKAIEYLAKKYPCLTEEEKEEIKVVADAYKVMTQFEDDEEEEEYSYDTDETTPTYSYQTTLSYSDEKPKKGFFGFGRR